ncbi:MAG: ABC transporter ATP-binding protein [SAR202 cluster bacterium]|jgi:putative ABC transport system ATP-binding protein|nr:ABC transporter ATP-binding protein [SAR202 cluster bacterium]|tara:strand:+ start:29723 stop:30436 length:714 start_codon:yes stop_codon:yes gene_type:complete
MSVDKSIISVEKAARTFELAGETVSVLKSIDLNVKHGEFVTLIGRSGSGKTTLLNLLSGLDSPTSGKVLFEDHNMADLNEGKLTELRRSKLGFVFQSFGLLPLLSAFENVELPLRISGLGSRERDKQTRKALDIVGLVGRSNHRPYELSGGEQQRVAIARAIVHDPVLILADEPTGELDSVNSRAIFGLFKQMVEENDMAVVAATHDSNLLEMSDRVLRLSEGYIEEDATYGKRFRD